jgi:L-serine dehydratase
MAPASIFNHVIGPVMRGPSSSHTAGAYHIAWMARAMLGEPATEAVFTFDRAGSYAACYREQGADRAFACGLVGIPLTDPAFFDSLAIASTHGLAVQFQVGELPGADHPNAVDVRLVSRHGRVLRARADSVGGGAVEFTEIGGWPLRLDGCAHETAVETVSELAPWVAQTLASAGGDVSVHPVVKRGVVSLVRAVSRTELPATVRRALEGEAGVRAVWASVPVFLAQAGPALFTDAHGAVRIAEDRRLSLGRLALTYEAELLGLPQDEIVEEALRRYVVMRHAVEAGLASSPPAMQTLEPSAGSIWCAEAEGRLCAGGLHTRAAARAMAVMHTNGSMGVVCAAPTGGSAGTLPGALVTLVEDKGLSLDGAALALLAAGAIGVVVSNRATFAAEVAGCQVKIGAAGAMAAAAVVDAAGGSPQQACDAAAIAFQNTMGSVCDLVQGVVEIPCHTRNAAAASNAFLCTDLILGGYRNPIPLDETIDAVYAVGRMLPCELRCTALGGLAATPTARAIKRRSAGPADQGKGRT